MEANFMSPLKRQKTTAQQAAGLFTPPPKKMLACGKELMATPGPCTPGAGLKAAGAGLLSQGQQTAQRMQAPLPAQLAVLRDALSALYATMPLVRSRGQLTTFQNMQQPVQNLSGRNFTLKHLRQIKHLYPDAFSWQALKPAGPATPSSKSGEVPLLLGLVHAAGKAPTASQHTRELERRLQEYARGHTDKMGCVAELPLADLPGAKQLPTSTPSKGSGSGACTSSSSGGLVVPATPQTAGGDRLAALLSPSMGTPAGGGSKTAPPRVRDLLMSPVGRRPPRIQQAGGAPAAVRASSNLFGTPAVGNAKTPAPAAARQQADLASVTPAVGGAATAVKLRRGGAGAKVRRLTFEDASPARDKAASASAAKAAVQAEPPAAAAAAPAQPAKGSGGLFQLPAEALALLQSQKEHEVAQQQASAQRADLDAAHALSLLPKSFEIVRGIFGERGPCVKPRDEVVSQLRLKCAFSCGLSTAQGSQQVGMLVRMLPEWLKQEAVQGAHLLQLQTVQQLRVNRQQPATQLRAKLRAEVEAATRELRAGGQPAEAAGERVTVATSGSKAVRKPLVTAGLLAPSDQGSAGGSSCSLDDLLL